LGIAGARIPKEATRLRRDSEDEVTQEIALPEELRPRRNSLTLQVVKGPRVGEILTVDQQSATLGRGADADLRIPDPSLSRIHARFERDGEALWVVDLGSRNGTAVDGARISERKKLENGEHITVGNVILRFAVQDSQALKVSRDLYEAAVRDRLTGMHNRGYFEDRIAAEFAFVRRHGSPLSVLLIDLDHFKKINDTFGHPVGDAVLKAAAGKITESLRAEDVAARYGGEEFVVLARGTGVDGARVLGQRLRTRIALAQVLTLNGIVQVTASLGIAVMQGDGSYKTPAELVAAADEALYSAKRNGRNQVAVNIDPQKATEKASGVASVSLSASSVLLSPPPKRE
jgi:two-component system cell cycle response regulator